MSSKRLILVAVAAAILAPAAAFAHHGWSGQESDKVMTLQGAIQSVNYRDPHGEISMTQNGQRWLVTLAPISRMQVRGLTEATLKPGQVVWVQGRRNTDTRRLEMKAENIRIGGKTTSLLR